MHSRSGHPTSPQRLTTSFFFSATFHVHLRNEMVWRRCTARVSYTPYRPTISIEPTAALRTVSMTPHVAQRLAHSRYMSVFFDASALLSKISGLLIKKKVLLSFTLYKKCSTPFYFYYTPYRFIRVAIAFALQTVLGG